ncbi:MULTISPECIES: tRNA uridine-5-carboxymethylaminomethyl(34) synthesis GTPase MnmE [Myxococcus]|uniref:tRNA modification GTPase MnmE n=1 Tax=Myxococcus llanfairpwllgwyngyllgogerychwyrndrobwllllantysiliogogogochensis TaxID=2590453 RepID=A0A540WJZ7_9BACT|nr:MULTISPECIES: tRNA uridine-5-carboxymethylaminomethyl(34) synthesis GTPase MnmE [Myxococcus]NTX05955.1 tRNA uridine-5-carboxymethylaminomethyl(34) synthesis GTPase MnmE [Myxococcus sp. CA040A]TQF09346.1 tRNA uridine-5-carboxymethylaminomethyl(34) synthesis GTPase MnmE [Myxococcus llanfairpwllgwyngyllgogerychwyrndrobwllllantysiliogogogochensis]
MTSATSTIVALATAPTAGAVGILRLSGPAALEVGRRLAPSIPVEPTPRHAYLAGFVDAQGRALDEGLFLYFRAPSSFTGEDVVELQAHGSPRLLQLLLARALEDGLARPAAPGEFTRRAFLNGRIDLTRAEAVADLVAADSESAVRAAAAGLSGALTERVRALEEPLRSLHADLEGVLNFPDEAEGADEDSEARVQVLRARAEVLLSEAGQGRLVRRGARVALFGPVNAGKSTLFNRLVGEVRALVDDEPGTTRDALEARVEWNGLGVTLFDTAGLRETPGRVEALGIARTRELLAGVDLTVLVLPPGTSESDAERWRAEAGATDVLVIDGKCDVGSETLGAPRPRVSGLTGEGVDALRESLLSRLWGGGTPSAVALVSERHADALRRAAEALARAESASRLSTLEVVSGELALALEALGELSGTSASEALIDAIFQRFCIGK